MNKNRTLEKATLLIKQKGNCIEPVYISCLDPDYWDCPCSTFCSGKDGTSTYAERLAIAQQYIKDQEVRT